MTLKEGKSDSQCCRGQLELLKVLKSGSSGEKQKCMTSPIFLTILSIVKITERFWLNPEVNDNQNEFDDLSATYLKIEEYRMEEEGVL